MRYRRFGAAGCVAWPLCGCTSPIIIIFDWKNGSNSREHAQNPSMPKNHGGVEEEDHTTTPTERPRYNLKV